MEDTVKKMAEELEGLRKIVKEQEEVKQLAAELEGLRKLVTEQAEVIKGHEGHDSKPMVVMASRRLERFRDKPEKSSDVTIMEWVQDMRSHAQSRKLNKKEFASLLKDHLGGKARQEILGRGQELQDDPEAIIKTLVTVFSEGNSLPILQQKFYSYRQGEEDLVSCSLKMVELYDRISALDPSFIPCRNSALKGRLAEAVRDDALKRELRRLNIEHADLSFFQLRDRAILWLGKSTKEKGALNQEVAAENASYGLHETIKRMEEIIERQEKQIDSLLKNARPPLRRKDLRCYGCGEKDHLIKQCPNNKKQEKRGTNSKDFH